MHIEYLKGTYSTHFRVQIFTLTLELLCMSSKHFLIILYWDLMPPLRLFSVWYTPFYVPTISSHLSFDWWSLINRRLEWQVGEASMLVLTTVKYSN